jgi:hypothetical protein
VNRLLTLSEMAEKLTRTARTFKTHVVREGIPHIQDERGLWFCFQDVIDHLDPRNRLRGVEIPRKEFDGGTVYLLHAEGSYFYKIGYSANNLAGRLRQLQSGCPFELRIRATRPGTMRDERNMHSYFSPFRVDGRTEWFEFKNCHWSSVVPEFLAYDGGYDYRGNL